MATVTIKRGDGGEGPVALNAKFKLQAEVDGGSASAYQWKRDGTDVANATNSEYEETATADTKGSYTVVATVNGQSLTSAALEIKLAPAGSPGAVDEPTTPPPEPAPDFHPVFAVIAGVVTLVLAFLLLREPARSVGQMKKSDWLGNAGDEALAATLGVPLTVIGGAIVALGAWMAAVEWRGRFKPEIAEGEVRGVGVPIDVGKLMDAIGKLRGAPLVMVVGATLMLGGAWIAKGATEPDPAGGTTPPPAEPSPPTPPTPPSPPTPTTPD